MAAAAKPSVRAPGRTPPFILIGLIVLMAVLGYNYWSLWTANADMSAQIDVVRIQKKDGDNLLAESEKKVAAIRNSVVEAHENNNKLKKQIETKDIELNNLKTDVKNKESEANKFKDEKTQCQSKLDEIQKERDGLKGEKENLQKQLDEAKNKQTTCDFNACKDPVKSIISLVAKLSNPDDMSKVLSGAGLDPKSLLEGVQFPTKQDEAAKKENKAGNQAESRNADENTYIQKMIVDDRNNANLDLKKNVEGINVQSEKIDNEAKEQLSSMKLEKNDQAEDTSVVKESNAVFSDKNTINASIVLDTDKVNADNVVLVDTAKNDTENDAEQKEEEEKV